ncbi:MAG: hypothetical protein GQ557_02295 [Mycoplasmataceae bacterium]|nr:hypothetical protein [Mycoplasmataceae bacterium]
MTLSTEDNQRIIEIEPAISGSTFDFELDPSTKTIKMDYKIVGGDDKIHQHVTTLNEPAHIDSSLALLDVGETAKICMIRRNGEWQWLYVM